MTKVVFPCEQDTWPLVKEHLEELKEFSLEEDYDLRLLAKKHQKVYSINAGLGAEVEFEYGQCVFYGLTKFLRQPAHAEVKQRFFGSTLPTIIDLAVYIEDLLPAEGLLISSQQEATTTRLGRQLLVSILACSFLCLFPPSDFRGRGSKLNIINFDKFFVNLPIPSQNAKLQCILNYFDRASAEWTRLTGCVLYSRQVIKREELPTMDTWLNCPAELCPVNIHETGVIEDAGCEALEIDFANRSIGGGTLGRGRVQEEIRFTVCPELIVSMLFMEVMEDNEAIVIQGYEQFSACEGYAAGLQYAGDYKDPAEIDAAGNLKNTLCAIDAISYRYGDASRQYSDNFVLRDLNKAFTGFCTKLSLPTDFQLSGQPVDHPSEEEEYYTAEDTNSLEDSAQTALVARFVERLLTSAVSLALPEAVRQLSMTEPCVQVAVHSGEQASSEQASGSSQEVSSASHSSGSSSGGAASMDHLEVNFRDWLTHYRRRSSNLSDLSSRRSSYDLASRRSSGCSTRYSSEFSTDFEELYDNFQQHEQTKYKYHTIKEEVYTRNSALNDFAATLASSLISEGTKMAVVSDAGVKHFHSSQPSCVVNKPQPVKVGTDPRSSSDSCSEDVVRKFVDDLFLSVWPFPCGESLEERSEGATSGYHSNCRVSCQETEGKPNSMVLREDVRDDQMLSDLHLATADSSEAVARRNKVLLEVANRIVSKALCEALEEYRTGLLQRHDAECSQTHHSKAKADHPGAIVELSCLSGLEPAERVADKVMSEIFKSFPDRGERCVSSVESSAMGDLALTEDVCDTSAPKADSCDFNAVLDVSLESDTAVHDDCCSKEDVSTSKDAEKADVEMYQRIADKILKGGLMSAFSDVQSTSKSGLDDPSGEIDDGCISPIPESSQNRSHNSTSTDSRSNNIVSCTHSSPIPMSSDDTAGDNRIEVCFDQSNISHSPIEQSDLLDLPVQTSAITIPKAKKGSGSSSSNITNSPRDRSSTSDSDKNFDHFASSLSRHLLTNAFLEVQNSQDPISYPRRSSEPMQISNGAALQRLEHSAQIGNGHKAQKSKTAEDVGQFVEEISRHGATCDVGRSYRRSSSGFRDPVLSKFAEELTKANVKVPTFQLLNAAKTSVSGSTRSACSTVSSFRDPVLASFEEELLNSSVGKSSLKSSKQRNAGRQARRRSHGSELVDVNANSAVNGANNRPINSMSFDSEMSGVSWRSCIEDVTDFAEELAKRILRESVCTACQMRSNPGLLGTGPVLTLDDYCNMVARDVLRMALSELESRRVCSDWLAQNKVCSDWLEQNKMVTWNDETERLEYSDASCSSGSEGRAESDRMTDSGDSTSHSLDYEDALDIPYQRLEEFADCLAGKVLFNSVAIWKREKECLLRKEYGRPISTGNWGCGAFGGDPHLKCLLQWMAASYAGTPCMLYFSFRDHRVAQLQAVVEVVQARGWDVASLMQAVRRYCITAQEQIQEHGVVSHSLFDVILNGEVFPGIS